MDNTPDTITVTGTAQQAAWRDRVLPPTEQIRRDVWSIPTPFPNNPLRYVISYAVSYGNGIALIDTGWPCEEAWDGLVGGLHEAGWDIADVKAVLVTHGHADHYGLARRIREHTGAWIAMPEADAKLEAQHGDSAAFQRADDEWLLRRGGLPADITDIRAPRPEMFEQFDADPDRFLEDGGTPLGTGSDLTAIWTPGHTPGHTCFFDAKRNVILTGDHVLPRITPNISPSPGQDDDSLGDYLASLAMLAGLDVDEVLPAHEYRFRGLTTRVHQIRHHHEIRLHEVLDVLDSHPGANTVDVAAGLHWSRSWEQMNGMPRRFAIGEAYAHLVHLEHTGFIRNAGSRIDEWHRVGQAVPRLG